MIRLEHSSPTIGTDLIEIANLRVGYLNRRGDIVDILRGVDLTISPGETLGLVGESGSEKSTLALALLGYLRRGSRLLAGAVTFHGNSLFGLSTAQLTALRGSRIALVPQDAGKSLTPTMRIGHQVEEAITLYTDLGQSARRQWLIDLLHQVRLPEPERLAQRYPHELSGAQQQRVAIAIALAGRPDVLVLDEPSRSTVSAHGCPFQARCPLNLGECCRTQTPPWQNMPGEDGNTHHIRCHIPWQELAGQTAIRFD